MVPGPSGSKKALETLAYLRERITTGEWAINTRIPKEPELVELLGVGRSTVREAVRSLANLGMLETVKGVGTFVRSRTPVSMLLSDYIAEYSLAEVLVYRRALEVEAAYQAALRRTPAQLAALRASYERDLSADPERPLTPERGETPGPFHHLIFEAAGNALLSSVYAGVMAAVRRGANEGVAVHGVSHEMRHRDHGALLAAIEAQDATLAAREMGEHVERDLVAEPPA